MMMSVVQTILIYLSKNPILFGLHIGGTIGQGVFISNLMMNQFGEDELIAF